MSGIAIMVLICIGLAGLIMGFAYWLVIDQEFFDLDKAIGRGIAEGVAQGLERAKEPGGAFDQAIIAGLRRTAMENHPIAGNLDATRFVWQCAFEFMRTDLTMRADAARDLAVSTVREFLRDEKIRFGAAGYAWDQSAAITLAREYEIEHWEAA